MTQRVLANVRAQIERIRTLAQSPAEQLCARREHVSGWTPAEHLDHMCKVSMLIVRRINEENVKPSRRGISLLGRVILLSGWIPRGRVKAPERVVPVVCSGADIEAALVRLEQEIAAMKADALASRIPTVPHPVFRGLTPLQALRFMEVHTKHHLRIVAEILG